MKRIAIIDLGTNTFHLLIAEFSGGKQKEILKIKEVVRLAEDGINVISDMAFIRAFNAMIVFKMQIDQHKLDEIYAFGTAALREAKNGKELMEKAKEFFGISVKIISGEKEAELIYYGVRQAVSLGSSYVLIMDIGGGSVEFIIANKKEIFWKGSFKIGAAILRAKFHKSEPLGESEKIAMETFLEKELQPLFAAVKKFPMKELIGSSGSFDTISEMIVQQFYKKNAAGKLLHSVTEFEIKKEYFQQVYQQLLKSTLDERKRNKAIVSYRADMIVVSAVLIEFIFRKIHIQKINLSTYALKEGALWCVKHNQELISV